MFLGKAVVLSILVLLLVQLIASTETCYLETEINKLPTDVQKILTDRSNVNSLRCPYSKIFRQHFFIKISVNYYHLAWNHGEYQLNISPPLRRQA